MPTNPLDGLYRRVARKVLTETLHVKKGEAITVETWNTGLDFATRMVAEARSMGCTAIMILEDEDAYVEGVRRAPKDWVGVMGKNEYNMLAGTDAYVFVPGPVISAYSKRLTAPERDESTRYNSSWYDAAEKAKLRGARLSFGYIGKDLARMLGKSITQAAEGQLKAALVDFGEVSKAAGALEARLTDGAEVMVESGDATLSFNLKGELDSQDGLVDDRDVSVGNNMAYVPPGFVSKGVDPNSVDGRLKMSPTLTRLGVVSDAEFEFKEGRLVTWKSGDRAKLTKLLDPIPEDKRRLSVMGIGLNPAMKYGFGQDRFVGGAVTLGGLGFSAVVRRGTVSTSDGALLRDGKLLS
jgi:leucyl aminopeptidase (aminopeptidase T)